MILLIDNYDSFTYNLYQFIGIFNDDIKVVRNDCTTIEDIEKLNPESIVISPGPKSPKEAGICLDVIRHFAGKKPILGICLGHQCIGEAFGGTVSHAKKIFHGKIRPDGAVHRLLIHHAAAFYDDADAEILVGSPRAQFHLCHGGDRSQSLATETHSAERKEVFGFGNL